MAKETRLIRARSNFVAEGRPVAFMGNRRLYAGDVVEYPKDAKLPEWAAEVPQKEAKEVEVVKPGPVREVWTKPKASTWREQMGQEGTPERTPEHERSIGLIDDALGATVAAAATEGKSRQRAVDQTVG